MDDKRLELRAHLKMLQDVRRKDVGIKFIHTCKDLNNIIEEAIVAEHVNDAFAPAYVTPSHGSSRNSDYKCYFGQR